MKKKLRAWLRRLACRHLDMIGREEVPVDAPPQEIRLPDTGWDDLWTARERRIVWPRIVKSDVWRTDFEPWFRLCLLLTYFALTREDETTEESRARAQLLKVRARLIKEWLEAPRLAIALDDAAYQNSLRSGNLERFAQEMERANAGHRSAPAG